MLHYFPIFCACMRICLFLCTLDTCHEPIKSFKQPLPFQRRRFLYRPLSITDFGQSQRITDLFGIHRPLLILFVRKDQQYRILQFLFFQHGRQFAPRHGHAFRIGTVHYENDRVGVGIVTAPVRSDTGLATQIPYLELEIYIYIFDFCKGRERAFYGQFPIHKMHRVSCDESTVLEHTAQQESAYFNIFILQGFDIKANGGYGLYRFVTLVL